MTDQGFRALYEQKEWLSVTSMNRAAQALTGWTLIEAAGLPLESVYQNINFSSRQSVESPFFRALREIVGDQTIVPVGLVVLEPMASPGQYAPGFVWIVRPRSFVAIGRLRVLDFEGEA